jgi:primosomal protein N' (replication factor Y) (superfamily II helicase)
VDFWLAVVVATPAHSGVAQRLTYRSEQPLAAGCLVRVPLGQREVLGIVWGEATEPDTDALRIKTKDIIAPLEGIAPLDAAWRALLEFAARYYQRGIGEVALAALPPQLRELDATQLARRHQRQAQRAAKLAAAATKAAHATKAATARTVGTADTANCDDDKDPEHKAQADATASSPSPSPSPASADAHADNNNISEADNTDNTGSTRLLSPQQTDVIAQFFAPTAPGTPPLPALLFGATGSGKTEVYLRCTQQVLQASPSAQVLVMVPEINLTPQLQQRFTARFAPLYGADAVVAMHSGMTPAQRLTSWLAAHTGHARIVLGTRMSVFASLPGLQLIVVDEEHDPSYKSQDGARHSARDLAVLRAKLQTEHAAPSEQAHSLAAAHTTPAASAGPTAHDAATATACRVMLGSATPSLETWHACETGRYTRLAMPQRVGDGALAALRLVDMRTLPKKTLFAPALLQAIGQRIARGEQSLIFLNRRGYAPVLACGACEWKSNCPHCSAYRVFHKIDRTLRCHHCGTTDRVPRACPDCGNIDIAPIGRGTEKLEEQLAQALGIRMPVPAGEGTNVHTGMGMEAGQQTNAVVIQAPAPMAAGGNESAGTAHQVEGAQPAASQPVELQRPDGLPAELLRPDGRPAVIARMDADTTRLKGALEQQLASVHSGDVDVLVGTQMIAKGHDFRRITLVAAINPDSALYSSDFRAPERLFSLLMQASGRAGRDAALQGAQMWVQTQHPDHPLFASLKAHDYPGFAAQQLRERVQAGLPPASYQALIRAEARTQEAAQAFLQAASAAAADVAAFDHVTLYPSVPMSIQRVANVERAQMLVESTSRAALQKFLSSWQSVLRATKIPGVIRWAMDVDPLLI